jgi:predicted Zn-dependent protease
LGICPEKLITIETADLIEDDFLNKFNLMQNRIEVFKQMLAAEPDNTMVMFGLAKEYEKLGETQEVIDLLENYLVRAEDEGNAYGMLARAYQQAGDREKAIQTYERGIEVSLAHGHPSMANDYRMTLDLDFAD